MASAMVVRSSILMVFLLSVGVVARASFPGQPPAPPSFESIPEPPFDAVEYKQYLANLKCPKIFIYHRGIKIPEDATESIYRTKAKDTKEDLLVGWTDYNWYQVLLDNGGPPGGFLQKGQKSNLTKALDPCSRPLEPATPSKKASTSFGFSHSDFQKIYREERAVVQFPGTPQEFVDVTGQLVWPPPDSKISLHISYRKDDTGLYVNLESPKCVFKTDYGTRIECETFQIVDSNRIYISPSYVGVGFGGPPASGGGVSAGLTASLVGGGR